ncbi:PAS domain-containing sensor histidine kinase [Tissierella creatinophila]|uniref:histidine kinase n=1 Tax=Tissierella creatinophila DSM 6911 TaxID=1123403 RepID=A0A1U7M797_TISCR|nr:HAMP domain-containing sensor histidine kinase [Tissierella creatinophila]OLS03193.1 alkaline phosphatase synthesis sensor protein PhoR [Tissierella creatinophila DSM 6911]
MKIILHKSIENMDIYFKEDIVYRVNKGFLSLTGYLENEVIGKSIDDLSSLLKLDFQIDLKKIYNPYSAYIFTKWDNPKGVNISSRYNEDKEERIYSFKEIENQLLDHILENIFSFNLDYKKSIAVYSIDDYILLKSNKPYIDLLLSLDISTENLLGKPPIFPELLLNCNKNIKYGHETEVPFINKDDSISYFDISTIPLSSNGEEKYLLNVIHDVTEEVNKISLIAMDITEEEKSNEKLTKGLKSQEEMFVNASHELKTPLNLIFSASQLLDQDLKKNSSLDYNNEINYSNKIILRNCYRLTKLIDNILDISKLESGFYKLNLKNEDIVAVTEDIIQSVAKYIKEKGLKIVFDTEIEEKIIGLDLYKFERIMLNLISNAIKFSYESGTIFVNLYYKEGFIEITVEDEGIGIAKENLEIIFDKFHQVNKSLTRTSEGSGRGLSLVKSLVRLHSGEISVESTLRKGTRFTLKLPDIVVEKQEASTSVNNNKNIEEMIKFELSDIY